MDRDQEFLERFQVLGRLSSISDHRQDIHSIIPGEDTPILLSAPHFSYPSSFVRRIELPSSAVHCKSAAEVLRFRCMQVDDLFSLSLSGGITTETPFP